jgi:hypothetical protein
MFRPPLVIPINDFFQLSLGVQVIDAIHDDLLRLMITGMGARSTIYLISKITQQRSVPHDRRPPAPINKKSTIDAARRLVAFDPWHCRSKCRRMYRETLTQQQPLQET